MTGKIDARLAELGIEIPDAPAPAADYVPFVVSGSLVFVAGQVPVADGKIKFTGRLGEDMDVDEGYRAARLCGLNLIAQAKAAGPAATWSVSSGSSSSAVSSIRRPVSPTSRKSSTGPRT